MQNRNLYCVSILYDVYRAVMFCRSNLVLVPYLSSELLRHGEYRGWWRRQERYAKFKLQKTASFIEFEPLNVYQSTHKTCSLPWYFRSDPVGNAFATNVSYSVGHL